jgi:hypothetical protein
MSMLNTVQNDLCDKIISGKCSFIHSCIYPTILYPEFMIGETKFMPPKYM